MILLLQKLLVISRNDVLTPWVPAQFVIMIFDTVSVPSPVGEITAFGLEVLIVSDFLEIYVKGLVVPYFTSSLTTPVENYTITDPKSTSSVFSIIILTLFSQDYKHIPMSR